MKLAAGLKKVILINEKNAEENNRRANARGKIFRPCFTVWVVDGDNKAVSHEAFTWKTSKGSVTPRTTVANFPYPWAPTALRNTRVWLETEAELDISTIQPEET